MFIVSYISSLRFFVKRNLGDSKTYATVRKHITPAGIAMKYKNISLQSVIYFAIGTRMISKTAQLIKRSVDPRCLNSSPLYSFTMIRFKLLHGTKQKPMIASPINHNQTIKEFVITKIIKDISIEEIW